MDQLSQHSKCFAVWMVSRSLHYFILSSAVVDMFQANKRTNEAVIALPNFTEFFRPRFFFFSNLVSFVVHPERFGSDQVINTVLNINDSKTAGILNNFNVSKDEILRRISALQPATQSSDNARLSLIGERNVESETNPSPAGTDAEKQE